MDENQIKLTKVPEQAHQFSTKGVKLSSLKESNELLFNYFTKNGYKEDAIIFSTDIDKLTQEADTNGNEKLSIREARALGLEGKRKDVRSAIKQLNEIKNTELESNADGNYPITVNDNETDFYNKDGVLLSNIRNSENGKVETFYLKGDKNNVDKTIETSVDGKNVTETLYKDGNIEFPEQQTIKKDNETTTIKYDWFNDKLNSKTTSKGNDIETVIYKQINGKPVPEKIVSTFDSDRNSVKSTVNKFNDDGKVDGQIVEYSGAKIGENLIKEDIVLNSETGEKVSEEATFVDNSKKYFENMDGKLQQVGKDKDGNSFVVLDVPKGWSMSKIANEFGISREDLVKANTTEDGTTNFHKTQSGVEYFYVNDKAVIPKPTKIPTGEDINLGYEMPQKEAVGGGAISDAAIKNVVPHRRTDNAQAPAVQTHQRRNADNVAPKKVTVTNNNEVHKSPTTAHATKKTTNYSVDVKKRIAKAKSVSYEYKSNKARGIQRSFSNHDPRVLVKKTRTGKALVGEELTEYNIKNTMCGIAKDANSTLPSILLRAYSKPDKKYPSGVPYQYDYNTLLADLKFVKDKIEEARDLGYSVPDSLYSYIPPKDGNPKRIAIEVRAYEAVFGKGSAHYSV